MTMRNDGCLKQNEMNNNDHKNMIMITAAFAFAVAFYKAINERAAQTYRLIENQNGIK